MKTKEHAESRNELDSRPLLRIENLSKAFPGVQALADVTLDFMPGEIHSIVGENGAGKSTLMKIISGFERADSGSVKIGSQSEGFRNPRAARRAGVTYVPQNPDGVARFSVGRNLLLGQERYFTNRNRLSQAEEHNVKNALETTGITWLTGKELFEDLSVAEIRLCQVAGALADPGQIVILDEPTAVLSDSDARILLDRVSELRKANKSVIYISHRLNEVMEISDRISVLRDGKMVGSFARGEISRDEMIDLMARVRGSQTKKSKSEVQEYEPPTSSGEPPLLEVKNLTRENDFKSVSFSVMPGEVVGIAGIQGSGHTRIFETIVGVESASNGVVKLKGRELANGSVHDALSAGIRLVPADRRERGIVGCRSVLENIAIGNQRHGIRNPKEERQIALEMIEKLEISTAGVQTPSEKLSGGNQQKVVIARMIGADPSVLLLSEPTQGIDVRSKAQILRLLREIARERNIGVVISSSEFEEVLEYSDRIYVMKLGEIASSYIASELSYNELLRKATP